MSRKEAVGLSVKENIKVEDECEEKKEKKEFPKPCKPQTSLYPSIAGVQPWQSGWPTSTTSPATTSPSHAVGRLPVNSKLVHPHQAQVFRDNSGINEPDALGDQAGVWETHLSNAFLNGLTATAQAAQNADHSQNQGRGRGGFPRQRTRSKNFKQDGDEHDCVTEILIILLFSVPDRSHATSQHKQQSS
ncbi:hypothetical protein NQZ68_008671 [Dissostichus eleginoides]|nr:hypothetical protein NQZ68_008671 [Dissostichus eleginoides]